MNILIAYHSRSGSTKKVAEAIERNLKEKGHQVDVEVIEPKKERGFWAWQFLRIFRSEVEIKDLKIEDVSKYDSVILGCPNWTKVSLPMRRYISKVKGLREKNIGIFATTAFWPTIEWYIFSAYILFTTFDNAISQRGGQVEDSILLTSLFKSGNVDSKKGKEKIESFCQRMISGEGRYRSSIIARKEAEDVRLLAVLFSGLIIVSAIYQALTSFFSYDPIDWSHYWILLTILFLTLTAMVFTIERRKDSYLVKFLAAISLTSSWALVISGISSSQGVVAGYVSIFIIIGLFKNITAVLIAGISGILGYSFIYIFHPAIEGLQPTIDIISMGVVLFVVMFVTHNIQKYFFSLVGAQEDAETSKTVLEIRVRARTRELEEFNKTLEERVKERTEDLRKKVDDLEKFTKLTVGRELRMIELKEKLKEMEEKLEEKEKNN
ncbi:MAG: flavodoxin family protein [Minisyncoccales bacterium]|jgi:hypothetical protein